MLLLVGPIELLLLLGVLWVALALSGAAALWGVSLGVLTSSPAVAIASTLVVGSGAFALAEQWSRRRAAQADPRWLVSLGDLSRSQRVERTAVGGVSLDLAAAYRMGLPIPETQVLTAEATRALLLARRKGAPAHRALRCLPRETRRRLRAFLRRCGGRGVTIRSSFAEEGEGASFAGIFRTFGGVDARSVAAVVEAIFGVLDSAQSDAVQAYRRRLGAEGRAERAVVLQLEMPADTRVTGCSRGPDGRADWVTVDWRRRRSPVQSAHYSIIEDRVTPVGPGSVAEVPPVWLTRIAFILMALEAELGSPVVADFALVGAEIILTRLQRHPDIKRTTWIHRSPIDFGDRRLPRLRQDLFGGIGPMREALNRYVRDVGLDAPVGESELRDVAGVPYLDALAFRRIVASFALDLLLRMDVQQVRRLLVPTRAPKLPPLPADSGTLEDWRRFRAWYDKHCRVAADSFVRLGLRRWLVETARRALRLGPFERPRRVWNLIARRLERQGEHLAREQRLVGAFLTQVQERFGDLAGQLMTKGTVGFGDLFAGAKYQHASLEQVDQCLEDPQRKASFEASWDAQRRKFAALEGQAIADLLHHPKLPAEPGSEGSADSTGLAGVGLSSGRVSAPAVRVGPEQRRAAQPGAILVLSSGGEECASCVVGAQGVVLLGGGVLSPVARVAAELGLPAVLCTRPAAQTIGPGSLLQIDGHAGAIQVGRA